MANDPNTPTSLLQERQLALREKMRNQHPFHERLALIYDQMGGDAALLEWAEDNPTQFYQLMMKASPPPLPNQGKQGGLSLTLVLPEELRPGPLDVTPIQPALEHDAG